MKADKDVGGVSQPASLDGADTGLADAQAGRGPDATGLPSSSEFQRVWSYKGNGNRAFEPTRYDPLAPEDAHWIAAQLEPAVEAAFGLPVTFDEINQAAAAA